MRTHTLLSVNFCGFTDQTLFLKMCFPFLQENSAEYAVYTPTTFHKYM